MKEIEELYPHDEALYNQSRLKLEQARRLKNLALLVYEQLRDDIECDEALIEQELHEQRLRSRRRCCRT